MDSEKPKMNIVWNPFKNILRNKMQPAGNLMLRWGYSSEQDLIKLPIEVELWLGEDKPASVSLLFE